MYQPTVNVEEVFKKKVLECGNYEFTNYAMKEWEWYGGNISGMITNRIYNISGCITPEKEMDAVNDSIDLILDQMKQKFSKMKNEQECFYSSPSLQPTSSLVQPVVLTNGNEPQVNLVQRYVEEVQKVLMSVATKYNTQLSKIAICEMIWEINTVLSYFKNNQYPRFYFQIWYDAPEHTIRVELFDPFDMIPEDRRIHGILVQVKDTPVQVEQSKPQKPSKEEDPFEDVPKDEEEDVPSVRECVKRPSAPVTNIGHRTRVDQKTALLRREMNLRILYALKQKGVEWVSALCIGGFLEKHITPVQHKNLLATLYNQGLIQKFGTTINARYRLTPKGEDVCASLEPLQLSWLAWFDNMLGDADEEWKLEFYNTLRDTNKAVFPYYKHYTHKREYRRLFYTGIIQADPNNGRCGCKEDTFIYTELGMFVKSEIQNEQEDNDAN